MGKKLINNCFKMWSNYVEAIDNYTKNDDEKFGRFMRILCNYGIYGEEIAETEIEKLFFTGVKSSIDASVQNIVNGRKGSEIKAEKKQKPTLEEIKAYISERKSFVDPQAFFDYYERNGWVTGKSKTPVKDWKACVRTWEHNTRGESDNSLHSKSDEAL